MRIKARSPCRGFTLFEITLVLMIVVMGSLFATNAIIREQQRTQAVAVGEQARTVADAVNAYIVNNYATLTGAATTTLTIADLRNATLLPASFSDTNLQDSPWNIRLRRTGAAPNWNIEGLVLITNPVTDGVDPNLNLSGFAMRAIGADGGMSYDGLTIAGLEGAWSFAQADYPGITQAGQVGVRVGYGTSLFTQFLRRDGTLPMTGNLNMGGQNVTAANSVATGTLSTTGTATLGGAVTVNSTLTTTGNVTAGGHTRMPTSELTTVVTEGASCAGYNTGSMARTSGGLILSCQSGTWQKAFSSTMSFGTFQTGGAWGGCVVGNSSYGNTCACPPGSTAHLAFVAYLNGFWSAVADYMFECRPT